MGTALYVGPIALPWSLLMAVAAAALGMVVGVSWGRRQGVEVAALAWRVLLVTIVVSRLAFVYSYRDAYLQAPLDILDIRDGGWNGQIGVIAGWFYAMTLDRDRHSQSRRPLLAGLGVATAAWVIGSVTLQWNMHSDIRIPAGAALALEGRSVELQSFAGKPMVVNLWATWCPPCRREMPLLQQAQADYPHTYFVFVNQGEAAEKVRSFLVGMKLTLHHVLLDPKGQATASVGGQAALPTTLFFDAQGRLISRYIGELSHETLVHSLAGIGIER